MIYIEELRCAMEQKFQVIGMTCSACSANIEKAVTKLNGIEAVQVNLLSNSMKVTYDKSQLTEQEIIQSVKHAGYDASPYLDGLSESKSVGFADPLEDQYKNMKTRLIVSFACLMPLMYISMGHMFGWPLPAIFHGMENAGIFAFTQFLLTLPIIIINKKYYTVGFKTLWHRSPNMDSLIAIGSGAALVYGVFAIYQIVYGLGHGLPELVSAYSMDLYFESAGTILTLITVGKFLETRSKGKTSEAIRKLLDLAPKSAIVIRDGEEVVIPIEEVRVGNVLVIKPGASIPVDGIILEGDSSIDEAALTGESIPVVKKKGDQVLAASINKYGFFTMEAQRIGGDTTLSQIIALVEEASESKAPIAKLADKVSGVFVPIVISIAVISVIIWLILGESFAFALSIGIAVLVISCPCALGLATPVAIMVGTGVGASNGILIKSAEALEVAHNVQTVVLDKTGTITEGKPSVTDVQLNRGVSEKELLNAAISIEKSSEHPLAEAVIDYATKNGAQASATTDFLAISGRGVVVKIDDVAYFAGNEALMKENQIDVSDVQDSAQNFADAAKTPLFFAKQGKLLGVIAVADPTKKTSREAIAKFKKMGIDIVMLTGDHKKTAAAICKQVGIDRVVAEVLPQDKEQEIRKLQESGRVVAMIGDGINDAPALVRADVGIAIGAGTDIAIESADIVLMKSDLLDAVTAIQLSKATIRNIKQNLFWAFIYNAIGIPLAAGVFYGLLGWKLNPMFAAAAMSLSSVCVVTNALRLKFFKPKNIQRLDQEERMESNKQNDQITIIQIEGMSCEHCSNRVENALNAIDGVNGQATVDLDKKQAVVIGDIDKQALKKAVEDAGYQVVSVR